MVPSYHLSIETPTPLVLGVGVIFAPVSCCDFCAFGSVTQWECFVRRVLALCKASSRPSGSVPLRLRLPLTRKLLREFRFLGLLLLLLPSP